MIKAVVFDYNAVINRRARIQPEILDLAKELRRSNIRTAILSNLLQPLAWFIKKRGKLRDFSPIIFTHEIGVAKPDPKSYEFVIKKLGLRAEECLFVDNRLDNIAGAEAVGMPVLLARNTAQTVDSIRQLIKTSP
jgi:HAD superfamily hydrolase (TIGR01509 family)